MNFRLASSILTTCWIAVGLCSPALAQNISATAQKPDVSWLSPITFLQHGGPPQPQSKRSDISIERRILVGSPLIWHSGLTVKVCPVQKSLGTCLTRTMPKEVGVPTHLISGNFVSTRTAKASWIVFSKTNASLCYLARASKTITAPSATVCRPINAPKLRDDVDVVSMVDHGRTYLMYTPKAEVAANKAATEKSINAFQEALARSIRKSQTNSAKRYAGALASAPHVVVSGDGGNCYDDDEGDYYCEGGDGGGSGGDGGGGGGGEGGGNGDGSGDGLGGNSSPPGGIANSDGSFECHWVGIVYICTSTASRPDAGGDPYEPPLPPPSTTSDPNEPGFLCRYLGWFCPDPANPPGPGPYEQPTANEVPPPYISSIPKRDDGRPYAKYRDGYLDELERCDSDRATNEQVCNLKYILLGGPILQAKPTLTPSERKQLKEANNEYSACMTKVGDAWGECYREAQRDYRDNN
jgi:hypothetical protein